MFNLIAIGDPIIDTHIQIDDSCAECHLSATQEMQLCFPYGSKVPIIDSFQSLGGNAPNVAVGATRLGLTTALVSTIGDDVNGSTVLMELKKFGVTTDYITTDIAQKTRYSIILNYKKERTILSYSDKKNYQWPEKPPTADWVYYTGLSEGFEIIQKNLLTYVELHPTVRLAVNPGSYMLKYGLKELRQIIKRTDLLIVNLEEAERILETTLEKEKKIEALIHELIERGAKEVVLTDGERGAAAGTKDAVWHLASYPVPVVAKTGAGDAFSAAYLASRYYGHDLPHAIEWGTANSCSVIQEHGPHKGLLDQKGIEKMINQFLSVKPVTV